MMLPPPPKRAAYDLFERREYAAEPRHACHYGAVIFYALRRAAIRACR